MWDPISSSPTAQPVGFASDDALEIEVRLAERCYFVPRSGRDIVSDLSDANVWHNFPDDIAESAYVDPWNYYVPADGIEASEQIAAYCPGIVEVGALAIQTFVDLDADPEANFSIGIRRPDLLRRGRWYRFGYPVARSDSSFVPDCPRSADASRARIRFELIPNTCTYFGVRTDCPFIIGFPRCDEAATNRREHFVYWTRICTPTSPLALQSADAGADRSEDGGMCVDGDDDRWFAARTDSYTMYGSLARDCVDTDAAIRPDAEDVCGNAVDEDCDGIDASCPGSCAGSASGTSSIWTCTSDLRSRQRCVAGAVDTEACPLGCVRQPGGTDDYCETSSCAASETSACADGLDNDCDGTRDCGDAECAATAGCVSTECRSGDRERCWVECVQTYDPGCIHSGLPPLLPGYRVCSAAGTWTRCITDVVCDGYLSPCTNGTRRSTIIGCADGTSRTGGMLCSLPLGTCSYSYYGSWPVADCSDICMSPDDLCSSIGTTRPCEVHCGSETGPTRAGMESCTDGGCGFNYWGPCITNDGCLR